jgi:hypothetical protein
MKKYELKVVQDESPESPREWDNVTTIVCFHKRYDLGDKQDYKSSDFNNWDELKEQIETDHTVLMIKPLFMYDHSGITISTSPFGCQWDSGQIGWVFIEEKQWISIMGEDMDRSEDRLNRIIESEVETYDKYLQGEVYQYKIYEVEECNLGHQHRTLVECCGGYFDEEDCRSEGESFMEHLEKEVVV